MVIWILKVVFTQHDRAWFELLIQTCTCLHVLSGLWSNFEVLVVDLLFIYFFPFLKHFLIMKKGTNRTNLIFGIQMPL